MRIIYAGTPLIAVPVLKELVHNFDICAVLTAPDAVSGRGKKVEMSDVKKAALDLDLSVIAFDKLGPAAREVIRSYKPDLLVCFAYRKIFGPKFMALFPMGGLNVHPSLLPKYRGPSPINAAILNRDRKTGISIQTIAQEMDTGNIIKTAEIELDCTETAESLNEIVAERAAEIITEAVNSYIGGEKGIKQDESKASYSGIIKKQDGLICWTDDVLCIEAKVRAYYPWPKTFTFLKNKRLSIISASVYDNSKVNHKPGFVLGLDKKAGILIQTGKGIIAVSKLQIEGKKAMDWKSFINGQNDIIQSILGDENT